MSLRVECSETEQSQYLGITSLRYRCVRNDKCSTGHDITHSLQEFRRLGLQHDVAMTVIRLSVRKS